MGLDLTFTTLSLSETFNGKLMPKGLGIVEVLVMTPEAVLGAVEAVKDPEGRGGWIGIAGWSGVLATHGLISVLAGIANPQPVPRAQPRDPHPPPPAQEEPERAPGDAAPSPAPDNPGEAEPRPATTSSLPAKPHFRRPLLVPATLTDGYHLVPGALLVGVF